MAAKKIEEMSTPEIQKLLKTLTLIISIGSGLAIVYFGLILYMTLTREAGDKTPKVIYPVVLLITMLPAISRIRAIKAELKKRSPVG